MAQEKPQLTAEQARAVLEKNVANVVKKAAAGATLSKREQDLIAKFAAEPSLIEAPQDWVSSYEALGKVLGLHRTTFSTIIRNHKGDPDLPKARMDGKHSVPAWRKFLEAHPEIKCKSPAAGQAADQAPAGPTKSAYELEILRQKCRRITFENDKAEGLYVLRSEVEAWAVSLAEKIKDILRSNLRNELPAKLEGLRAPEISARMEEPIRKISNLIRYCQAESSDDHRPAKE